MSETTESKNPVKIPLPDTPAAASSPPETSPPATASPEAAPATGEAQSAEAAPTAEAPATSEAAKPQEAAAASAGDDDALEAAIVEALETVYDPEIPVNIYELGLIYDIDIQEGNHVAVKMTLTSPACPVAGSLPGEVRDKVLGVPGVSDAEVDVVWDPVWNPEMMSESAKLQLGML